jgi:hypothetical protein
MALLDHFRPPLAARRDWHGFQSTWACYIAFELNTRLPEGYFAEPNVQFGIEIDVAAFDDSTAQDGRPIGGWSPPEPSATIPLAIVTDTVEVSIFASEDGPFLAGAIELVSPANKDRPAHRDAFTSKCAAYLQAGVGLIVVDVVTNRGGDLHAELMARLFAPEARPAAGLSTSAYRPAVHEGETRLEIWHEPIILGGSLPVMPLWLKGGPCLPVDLGATYDRTRRELRMGG